MEIVQNKNTRFWKVKTKFGHVGDGNYYEIDVPCYANTAKQAIRFVRHIGGVKHHSKFAVTRITEINYCQYLQLKKEYMSNKYIIGKSNIIARYKYKDQVDNNIKILPKTSKQHKNYRNQSKGFKKYKNLMMIREADQQIRSYMYTY